MKKVILIVLSLILAIGLGLGIFAFVTWQRADETLVPRVTVQAFGQTLEPVAYEWGAPLLGGLMTKHFEGTTEAATRDLGEIQLPESNFGFPAGYLASLNLTRDGEPAYNGTVEAWSDTLAAQPGAYRLEITCEKVRDAADKRGTGSFNY